MTTAIDRATAAINRARFFLAYLWERRERFGEQSALTYLYREFQTLLSEEQDYNVCDRILAMADVPHLSPVLLVAFLTATARARALLPGRKAFYERVRREIVKVRGEETAERILVGLE